MVAGIVIIRLLPRLGTRRCQASTNPPPLSCRGKFHIVERLTLLASFKPVMTMTYTGIKKNTMHPNSTASIKYYPKLFGNDWRIEYKSGVCFIFIFCGGSSRDR